jgi:hypothetical protein
MFHYTSYAHVGTGSVILGSAVGYDTLPGTLAYAKPLNTRPGVTYTIQLFHYSAYSGPTGGAGVSVVWNGKTIGTIPAKYEQWTLYAFTVTAMGNDMLSFIGGSAPKWDFLDDISVF